MTETVFVSNVDVRRSIGRPGTSWIDELRGSSHIRKTFLFVDQLVSTLKIKFENFVRVLFSIHVIVFEIIHIF